MREVFAISSPLPDTRQNKVRENNQMQSGEKEPLYDTVEAGSALPSGHGAYRGPSWQDVRVAGMENSPPDF